MSDDTVPMYKFKPFEFTVLKKNDDPSKMPLAKMGHRHNRVVCNDAHLYSYENFEETPRYNTLLKSDMPELWKYSFDLGEWKIIKCKDVPQLLKSSTVSLSDNIINIYGSTGFPSWSILVYLGNLANEYKEVGMRLEKLKVSGNVPQSLCGQGIVLDGKYIYSIACTSDFQHKMDVHRLDLSTNTWEELYKSGDLVKPEYRHEAVLYKGRIYIIGSEHGQFLNLQYGFSKIRTFDVTAKRWESLPTECDRAVLGHGDGYPSNRDHHSCVQCPERPNLVYICGGHDDFRAFGDVWRFDLDDSRWEKLAWCTLPQPAFTQSTAVTPAGRMCCYGGVLSGDELLDVMDPNITYSNDITSAWITIPKLKVICWEAALHYFKDEMFASSEARLMEIGLPREFYERIIEARKPGAGRRFI